MRPSPLAPLAVRLCADAYQARRTGIVPEGWAMEVLSDIDVYWFRCNGLCWLIVPGTDSMADWRMANLRWAHSTIGGVPGFWRDGFRWPAEVAWRFASRRLPSEKSGERLAIVGHSLGGAAVTVVGAMLARDGWADRVALLLSIAGPRVTTAAGARFLDEHYPPEIGQRLILGADPVPWSVLPAIYRHALKPFFVDSDSLELRNGTRYWAELWRAIWRRGWQSTQHHGIASYLRWAEAQPCRRAAA